MKLSTIFKRAALYAPNIAVAAYAVHEMIGISSLSLAAVFGASAVAYAFNKYLSPERLLFRNPKLVEPSSELQSRFNAFSEKCNLENISFKIVKNKMLSGNAIAFSNDVWIGEKFISEATPDEIDFIIMHELKHIEHDHGFFKEPISKTKNISNLMFSTAVAYWGLKYMDTIFNVGLPQFTELNLATVANMSYQYLIYNKLSRQNEYESDTESVKSLGSAEGAISFFERQKRRHRFKVDVFSSHPTFDNRIKNVQTAISEMSRNANSLSRGIA